MRRECFSCLRVEVQPAVGPTVPGIWWNSTGTWLWECHLTLSKADYLRKVKITAPKKRSYWVALNFHQMISTIKKKKDKPKPFILDTYQRTLYGRVTIYSWYVPKDSVWQGHMLFHNPKLSQMQFSILGSWVIINNCLCFLTSANVDILEMQWEKPQNVCNCLEF